MKTEPGRGEAVFTKTDDDGLEITKRFILPYGGADPYLARMRADLQEHRSEGTRSATATS